MKLFSKANKQETLVYVIVWTAVFLLPVVIQGYRALTNPEVQFQFSVVWSIWLAMLPFLVFFLLHNYLAYPFFRNKRYGIYACITILLVCLFWAFQWASGPKRNKPMSPGPGREPMEMRGPGGPDKAMPEARVQPPALPAPGKGPRGGRPAPMSPETMKIMMALLMLGANLAVKFYFRGMSDQRRMAEMEKENLRHQLDYFRYQINPHFFMNTLNNIHALVDIDPEQAKSSILELSKIMRYILYEGSKPTIPLNMETEFLRQYVSLMRMRYNDNVKIDVSLPENVPGAEVPPLVFVSFVENAFKHGVSYEEASWISVKMAEEADKLVFICENTRHVSENEAHSGIGMENVRKRFSLLYGDSYTMHVNEAPDKYSIFVVIPRRPEITEKQIEG